MTEKDYRAKLYELLEKRGHKEINGTLYYPEQSIMDTLEWVKENREQIIEVDLEKILKKFLIDIPNSITGEG